MEKPVIEEITIIPEWIPADVWAEYLAMRMKKKAVPTEYAKKLVVMKLERFKNEGFSVVDILNLSIVNSWLDVYIGRDMQKKVIVVREKKHEAEKKARAIPRKPNLVNADEIEKLRGELFSIGRKLGHAGVDEKLMLKDRLKKITNEIRKLKDDGMRLKA